MIDPEMCQAIYRLHLEGMSQREISRRLHVSRKAVKTIIRRQGKPAQPQRRDKIHVDAELLARLYRECNGWIQRIHEKLIEEEEIAIGYSTLTRLLRELDVSRPPAVRCERVPDQPGAEMQHDTTVYQIKLGGRRTRLIASLLYLRYSKRRYLRFYRAFNRFRMKCFLHEALMFWGYSAPLCIIDNTNLARLRGAGRRAVIVPEMEAFGRRYEFEFVCHELNHPDRKAGEERSFWTVETNFLPGRTFESLEDLNEQARQWATGRMEQRPQTRSRIVPAQAFEHERLYLHALPEHLPAPYQEHRRGTDQYGYVAFAANYYWVPGSRRDEVKVLEYADRLKICLRHTVLAEYDLPADGVREQYFSPPGEPKPRYRPNNRRYDARREEQRLRAIGEEVSAYLDFVYQSPGIQRHRFTRELFSLSRQLTADLFVRTVQRALRYRITDLPTLRRIAWLCLSQTDELLPPADVDEDFQQRPSYQEGCLTDQPDLSVYDVMADDELNLTDEPETPNDEEDQHGQDEIPF